jgi:hypothetical protein
MRRLAAAAVYCLLSSSAIAQDLPAILVAEASNGAKWFVRTDRVTRSEWATSVWLYIYPTKPAPLYKKKPTPTYNYQVSQWNVSCRSGTYTIGKSAFYTAKGDFLDEAPPTGTLETPTPDTIADSVVRLVCSADFARY